MVMVIRRRSIGLVSVFACRFSAAGFSSVEQALLCQSTPIAYPSLSIRLVAFSAAGIHMYRHTSGTLKKEVSRGDFRQYSKAPDMCEREPKTAAPWVGWKKEDRGRNCEICLDGRKPSTYILYSSPGPENNKGERLAKRFQTPVAKKMETGGLPGQVARSDDRA
jgi:hypothetical protein